MKNIEKIINKQLTKSGITNDDIAAWQHQQNTEIIAKFGVDISPLIIDEIKNSYYTKYNTLPNDEQIKVIIKNNNLGG
jgi:hypothetical protein